MPLMKKAEWKLMSFNQNYVTGFREFEIIMIFIQKYAGKKQTV